MKKFLQHVFAAAIILLAVFGVSSAALADAAMDFEVSEVGYENGVLKAVGKFTNTGDKHIEKVNKVDVKIFLYNDQGDSKKVADHYFTDLPLHLAAGTSMDYTLEFPDVAEYTDATKWSAEEGEWEFTFYEEAPAADAVLDFQVTEVGYENGTLKAIGMFINTGGKNIETVDNVDVKIWLHNDQGDSKLVAGHVFQGLTIHLRPGEEIAYTLEFTDVPEYTDATKWSAEEGEWTFTYFE